MKEFTSNGTPTTPMLFPFEPEQFWQSIRQIIREEVSSVENKKFLRSILKTTGLTLVVQTGDEVTSIKEGDAIGVPSLGHTCGKCKCCLNNKENLCERAMFTGYTRDATLSFGSRQ
jgi:hypothetical protein